jgi:hypothetical protein
MVVQVVERKDAVGLLPFDCRTARPISYRAWPPRSRIYRRNYPIIAHLVVYVKRDPGNGSGDCRSGLDNGGNRGFDWGMMNLTKLSKRRIWNFGGFLVFAILVIWRDSQNASWIRSIAVLLAYGVAFFCGRRAQAAT